MEKVSLSLKPKDFAVNGELGPGADEKIGLATTTLHLARFAKPLSYIGYFERRFSGYGLAQLLNEGTGLYDLSIDDYLGGIDLLGNELTSPESVRYFDRHHRTLQNDRITFKRDHAEPVSKALQSYGMNTITALAENAEHICNFYGIDVQDQTTKPGDLEHNFRLFFADPEFASKRSELYNFYRAKALNFGGGSPLFKWMHSPKAEEQVPFFNSFNKKDLSSTKRFRRRMYHVPVKTSLAILQGFYQDLPEELKENFMQSCGISQTSIRIDTSRTWFRSVLAQKWIDDPSPQLQWKANNDIVLSDCFGNKWTLEQLCEYDVELADWRTKMVTRDRSIQTTQATLYPAFGFSKTDSGQLEVMDQTTLVDLAAKADFPDTINSLTGRVALQVLADKTLALDSSGNKRKSKKQKKLQGLSGLILSSSTEKPYPQTITKFIQRQFAA